MTKIIILTGNEIRHQYFRKKIACDDRIEVLSSFCEGVEKSLENQVLQNPESSILEIQHVKARFQTEKDFFSDFLSVADDKSKPKLIAKGEINDSHIVKEIINLNPNLLVCYGSSLIKSDLLKKFKGRFLNVHLGLSPYYRGSGTNVWPLINNQPDMIGATFMYIDTGIDTGEIIHQIRADIVIGDSSHSIGNRLIRKMTKIYADLVAKFDFLEHPDQPIAEGKFYYQKDFNHKSCQKLYENLENGMIEKYLSSNMKLPYIVNNKALQE
tara:strand:- start:461 stop:1267 length:807 start_codon:yes stop_codon:yes gene_type:complete